jgi:hypothetical protein
LKYLNANYLLKGGLFCKKETRFSYDIKRMREEKGDSQPRGEKHPPSSKKLEIMHSSFFLISCSTNMQR